MSRNTVQSFRSKLLFIFTLYHFFAVIHAGNESVPNVPPEFIFEEPGSLPPGYSATNRQGKFITFGATDKTDILVKYTLPVLTIPTVNSARNGLFLPMVKVNVRNIIIFALLAIVSNVIYPLFVPSTPPDLVPPEEIYNHPPPHWSEPDNKKSTRSFTFDILNWKNSLNHILFRDNSVTPCVQRLVCSAVAESKNTDKPTNLDKIVDVMSSTMMFDQAANKTVIQEAVSKGRDATGPDECSALYQGCKVDQQIINNSLKMFGI